MRAIVKRAPPATLVEHRATMHADYNNYRDKETLRNQLVGEQHGICCYCLGRIRSDWGAMKIEHWLCQDRYRDRELEYANLLGACIGGEGLPRRLQHCDTRKGDADLSRNPANPTQNVENFIHYNGDGSIWSQDHDLNFELNEILNLNTPLLKTGRKAALDGFVQTLAKRGKLQRETLERWLHTWSNPLRGTELTPFCQVVVYWLRKRLARA